jgi:hypothetical protein
MLDIRLYTEKLAIILIYIYAIAKKCFCLEL